ncbi:MAG: type II toxin-antitoxin system VapC family toxin [Flavobacteriales bacterium]|jgi:PIN domain nuclease of toxin-antitoxin system|nr:type II toxin-antitoxin system VapC family toxin [Flavobacteriales bacterium]
MRFLLDTHTVLWFLQGNEQLPNEIRKLIVDVENECFVSVASLWEITVKASLGKLILNEDLEKIYQLLSENQILPFQIDYAHLSQLMCLEHFHRDPFDRLIIAQAKAEKLTVLTKDRMFTHYSVETRW